MHQELGKERTSKLSLAALIYFTSLFHIRLLHIPGASPCWGFLLTSCFLGLYRLGVTVLFQFSSQQQAYTPPPKVLESCNQMKSSEQDGKLQRLFRLVRKERDSGPKGGAVVPDLPQGTKRAQGIN